MSDVVEKREKKAHLWDRDPDGWYSEPEWVWRRFFEEEPFVGKIHDPCCGRGNVIQAARAAGHAAMGSDIAPAEERGGDEPHLIRDFMTADVGRIPNIASNPAFHLCDPRDGPCLVRRAIDVTDGKVALLLPTPWVNARSWLRTTPLYRVWWLTPRPSMPPGRVIMAGEKPGGGTKDFAIFVWWIGFDGAPTMKWLHRDEGRAS
jgi:hypothetical protein